MPFLLHSNLKADMWSKHKSFLTGSTGVGDKLKTLETFAKCKEDDETGLQNLIGAIAALMQVAVPAFQKAKSSKIIPSSTAKYLQEMIAKATELRALVAKKQEELKAPKNAPAPNNEKQDKNQTINENWYKNALDKIKSNRNSVTLLTQEINTKKLTGKDIEEFKSWANTSQTQLKKIFDDLNAKKIEKDETQKIESAINTYMNDLKEYQGEIKELIDLQGKDSSNQVSAEWIKNALDKIKSNRSSVSLLKQEITTKKLTGKDIEDFNSWANASQTALKQIFDDLNAKKIEKDETQKIESTINSYINDLKEYKVDIEELVDLQSKDSSNQVSAEWIKSALDKIKSNRNSVTLLKQEITTKHLAGKDIEEFNSWANSSQTQLKKIFDDLNAKKVDKGGTQKIESTINSYIKDLKEYQDEIKELIDLQSKDSINKISEEWIKDSIEKIRSNRKSVTLLTQEINTKKLTGKDIEEFKSWASTSQTKLKKIFDDLNAKKVDITETEKIESTINTYVNDLKEYEDEIKKL